MNLSIDNGIQHFIEYVKEECKDIKNTVPELEIRLSERGQKGVTKFFFEKTLEMCKKKYGIVPVERSIVTTYKKKVDHLTQEYRKIKTKDRTVCQIKVPYETNDRSYHTLSGSLLNVRYSFATEELIQCPPDEHSIIVYKRDRQRMEFKTDKGYTYMFTVIKTNKEITYECEVEFDIPTVSKEIVSESLSFLVGSSVRSNLTVRQEESLYTTVKDMLDKVRPPKPINFPNPSTDNKSSRDLRNFIDTLKVNYTVTNKLDGQRYFIFIIDGSVYSVQNDTIVLVEPYNERYRDLGICFADVEYFEGRYYFFDCYVSHGKFLNHSLLTDRINAANEIVATNPGLFVMKTFQTNLLQATTTLLDTLDQSQNDGLIYTPVSMNDNKMPVYKWKFPSKMSIDFRVTGNGPVYTLCVFTETDKKGFTPFMVNKKPATYDSTTPLKTDSIYEFKYQHGSFVLMREREDKNKPNFIRVAENVWKDIMNPFEANQLIDLFKPLRLYRKCHNNIKRNLINTYCKNKRVLDLGVGAGGDLRKYKSVKVSTLFGVEPYKKNSDELRKRLAEQAEPQNVVIIDERAQETQKIVDTIGLDGVDVVSSFFSLSFFFFEDRPYDLDQLVQTISQNLVEGGYFIGTTIDGEKTQEVLSDKVNQTHYFDDGYIQLQQDGTVVLDITGTIVERQVESLVNFKRLEWALKEVGIVLKESKFFPRCEEALDGNEQILNSLYRTFVFQKEKIQSKIEALCTRQTIYDLMTTSSTRKCDKLFEEFVLKTPTVESYTVPVEHVYNVMKQFYFLKKYINDMDFFTLRKGYALYGDRLHKTIVMERIPSTAITLREFLSQPAPIGSEIGRQSSIKAIYDQIKETAEVLQVSNINYGSYTEDGIMVNTTSDGLVQAIFYDYTNTTISKNTDYIHLLQTIYEKM